MTIFTISVFLAGGVFLYKLFLNYRISQMGKELENARATLSPETVTELTRLNNRITSTQELIRRHQILSPVFDFLAKTTPQSVRYVEFNYTTSDKGASLALKGEARGYTALAQAAEILNKSTYFKSPVFSDLNLDERGNVVFSLKTSVDRELLSYEKMIQKLPVGNTVQNTVAAPQATSSATITPTGGTKAATSTKPTN